MKHRQIGWDIGGAHLKAALLDTSGQLLQALQLPCALWKGMEQLETAIAQMLTLFKMKAEDAQHSVTMTGELVDLFASRREGVMAIANLAADFLGKNTRFYAVQVDTNHPQFITIDQVADMARQVASANWHASASYLKPWVSNALLIDMGSTTTDIVPIVNKQLLDIGLSDAERLQQNSLIYSGVIRTPVMALAQQLIVDEVPTNVTAEYFATMADVYRLTGELAADLDMTETADGQAKTQHCSARRLARMVGYDVDDKPMSVWQQLAQHCRALQLKQLKTAVATHLQADMVIVGAGAGAFLIKALAEELQQPYHSLEELLAQKGLAQAELCLPAYAVAYLACQYAVYSELIC